MDKCPKCGMLKDLCVCEILDKQGAGKIKVYVTKKKFRKLITVVEGIDKAQLSQTTKELKNSASGTSGKNNRFVVHFMAPARFASPGDPHHERNMNVTVKNAKNPRTTKRI